MSRMFGSEEKHTIAEWRLLRGMTQQELAEMTGLSYSTISHAETGQHTPGTRTLRRIAKALGLGDRIDLILTAGDDDNDDDDDDGDGSPRKRRVSGPRQPRQGGGEGRSAAGGGEHGGENGGENGGYQLKALARVA